MFKKRMLEGVVLVSLFLFGFVGEAIAQAEGGKVDVLELQRRIDIMSDELDSMSLGASGASQGFRTNVFGYGELHYNNFTDGSDFDQLDKHRFVIGVFSRISDWIQLNAEIDYEHGAQEIEFELGYLDFLLDPKVNFRAGVVLVPVGFLNEYHEPNLFWSVERPRIQNAVIPTSWQGSGAGFWGTPLPGLNYRFYILNAVQSIRPSGFDDGSGNGGGGQSGRFRGSSGIRSGRLQPNRATAEDFAFTGRLEYSNPIVPGLQLGFSVYTADTTHDIISEGGRTTLFEGDVKYRKKWFEMNSTIVNIDIDDAAALNTFAASAGTGSGIIPDQIFGWNIQAGVHVLQLLNQRTSHDVVVHYMYENIDLHEEVPDGFTRNSAREEHVHTFGVTYWPVPQVALKMDFQNFNYGNNTHKNQLNLAMGYLY